MASPGTFAVAVVSCLFLLTLLFMTPAYDVNDDPAMALVSSGFGTINGPDEHLIYTNVLIGKLLKQLYQMTPLIPWYGCYLLLVHFISYCLLLYVLLLLDRQWLSLTGFLLFYLGTGIYFLTHLQFTSTAFLLGLAGLSLILTNLIVDAKGDRHHWLKWGGALCLIASSLIRLPAFQMLVLASLPLLLAVAFQFFRQVKVSSYLAPAILTVIGVLGCAAYDQHYYQQDEGWQTYKTHLAAVAELINYVQIPYKDQTKPLFDEVGWSNYDFWMMKDWFYLDPEVYNVTRVEDFKKRSQEYTLWKFPEVMHYRITSAKAAFLNPIFLFCFIGSILIIRQIENKSWQRRTVKWMLGWTVLLMFWLLIYLKLPERVYIPLGCFPFFIAIFFNAANSSRQTELEQAQQRPSVYWGTLVLFLVVGILVWNQKHWSDQVVSINQRFKQDLKQLHQQMPDRVFLAWAPFPIDCFLPLDDLSESKDLKYLWLTGRQNTPLFQQRQSAYQIKSPYTDLYETDRLLLISNPVSNRNLQGYLKQHYGVNVKFQTVFKGGYFRVYQVIKAKDEPIQTQPHKKNITANPGTQP